MISKLCIILPTRNNLTQLKATVQSLINCVDFRKARLLIMECESTDGTREYCDDLEQLYNFIEVFHSPKTTPTKDINFGLKEVELDEHAMIIHDDIIFTKFYKRDFFTEAIQDANNPMSGILTCMNGGGVSGPEYLDKFIWFGTWCLVIPRHTLDKVGFFDENMQIGDDIDYSYRVHMAGLHLLHSPLWFEHHQVRDSPHAPEDTKLKEQNARYFREKHKLGEFNGIKS